MKPLLRWPGDRPSVTPIVSARILESLSREGRFLCLFTGGASVFFMLEPGRGVLVDARRPLMAFYEAVQRDPVAVHDELQELVALGFEEDSFNYVKDDWNGRDFGVKFAARFLYLNRVSRKGSFFADIGQSFTATWVQRKRPPSFPSLNQFRAAASLLRRFRLYTRDYSYIVRAAHAGDVIYADVPYWGTDVPYGGAMFAEREQRRLARLLGRASDRGVRVFVSNIECEGIHQLYGGWADIELLPVSRSSSGPGPCRQEVLLSATTSFIERNQLRLFEELASP